MCFDGSAFKSMSFGVLLAGFVAMAPGSGTARGAAPGEVGADELEHLGQPCRAKQVLGGCVVRDRIDGRERLVLTNDNEAHGCELLYIDFEHNTGEVFDAPAGEGSWAVLEVPGDLLVVGTFYDGVFMVFDLKAKKFVRHVDFPGESYIWNLAIGAGGRVYGGTYPGGKLGAIDPVTGEFEDCGAPAKPNLYLRNVRATPDGAIVCNFGMDEPKTLIYEPGSKKWSKVPGLAEGTQLGVGVSWNGHFVVSDGKAFRAYRDATFTPEEKLPFPPPESGGAWSVLTAISNEKDLFLQRGGKIWRYRKGDAAPTPIAGIGLRGGRYLAATGKGELLGVRGQDYFIVRPGDTELRLRRIPVEGRGRPALFLEADGAGRLWGGPHFGQTLFAYDVRSGKLNNTGIVCDAGGEVYDVTFHDGRVYAASYSGGDITCYDPDQPWDQWNHKNPRPLARVSPDYIRPSGGIVTGPDGKLYSGWMAKYGTYGGALAVTDPATGETDIIANPLGKQAVVGLAVDASFAYVGTSLGANGLRNQEGSAQFGVIKLDAREVVFKKSFDDCSSIGRVVFDRKTGQAVFVVREQLYRFDPKTMTLLEPAADQPSVTSTNIVPLPDGRILAAADKTILAIDLTSGRAETLGAAPKPVTHLALATDGRVYLACGPDLYRLKRPLGKPAG